MINYNTYLKNKNKIDNYKIIKNYLKNYEMIKTINENLLFLYDYKLTNNKLDQKNIKFIYTDYYKILNYYYDNLKIKLDQKNIIKEYQNLLNMLIGFNKTYIENLRLLNINYYHNNNRLKEYII